MRQRQHGGDGIAELLPTNGAAPRRENHGFPLVISELPKDWGERFGRVEPSFCWGGSNCPIIDIYTYIYMIYPFSMCFPSEKNEWDQTTLTSKPQYFDWKIQGPDMSGLIR